MTTLASPPTIDWYRSVAPLIARHFGGAPLVTARYLDGTDPTFSASLHGPAPGHEATVEVRQNSGRFEYLAVNETSILYQAHRYAVEVLTWAPRAEDSSRAAFARIIISPHNDRASGWSARVARVVRSVLRARHLDGIVVLEGPISATVWIPFSDSPAYDMLRAWLHVIAGDVVAADSAIDIKELHVSSNMVGRWSCVPDSLIGPEGLTAATPILWDELDTISSGLPELPKADRGMVSARTCTDHHRVHVMFRHWH